MFVLHLQTNFHGHIYITLSIFLLRRKGWGHGEGEKEEETGTSSVYKRLVYVCLSLRVVLMYLCLCELHVSCCRRNISTGSKRQSVCLIVQRLPPNQNYHLSCIFYDLLPVPCFAQQLPIFINWFTVLEKLLLSLSVVSDSLWLPWTMAHQVPLSMEISRPEYWTG